MELGKLRMLSLMIYVMFIGLTRSSFYEKALLTDLLTNYSSSTRPSTSNMVATTVFLDFKLNKIVKVDIKEQEIVVNARVLLLWRDPALIWKPSLYNGTNYTNIPSSSIWTPDVLLYNTASETSQGRSDVYKAHVRLNSTGHAIWMSPVTLRASCEMDVKWFPFDEQSCTLNFGSISLTEEKLDLRFFKQPNTVAGVKGQFHYSSGIWNLKSLTSQFKKSKYECCKEPFGLVAFKIVLKRLPTYWILYLVLPCVCLSIVSLCAFFIPPETGERIGFCITGVLAMSVYLLVISDKLPEKSDTKPLIGILYMILFIIMICILVSTVFTTHLAFKVTKPPRKLRHIFFARCQERKQKKQGVGVSGSDAAANGSRETELVEGVNLTHREDGLVELSHRGTSQKRVPLQQRFSFLTEEDQREIKNQEQWKEIAERVDKISFWFFLTLTIVAPGLTVGIYAA